MPAFTLGEIMSNATARIGRRADISASDASYWANVAYMEIGHTVPHASQESVVVSSVTSGTTSVALPADFGEPISFSLHWSTSTASSARSSTKTLQRISIEDAEAKGPYLQGEPDSYAFFDSRIELFPVSNSTYSLYIRYRKSLEDLTSTSSVPSLHTPWRPAIQYRTEALLAEWIGDFAGAALAQNRYLQYVSTLKTDEARRQSTEGRFFIRPVY